MSWSLGEIQALAVKAARGAGMSWGVADEAGFAVRWLHTCGAPGVAALAALLQEHDTTPLGTPALSALLAPATAGASTASATTAVCPLRAGIMIVDHRIEQVQQPVNLRQPMLLLPFLAQLLTDPSQTSPTTRVQMSYQRGAESTTTRCIVDQRAVTIRDSMEPLPDEAQCVWQAASSTSNSPDTGVFNSEWAKPHSRVPESQQAAVRVLAQFAQRTYAPVSDESRIKGAGAGLNDND